MTQLANKIVLDTNIILSVFELKIDILALVEEEFGKNKVITISTVAEELQKEGKNYALARKLLEKIPIMPYSGKKTAVDDTLIDFCEENACVLATQDVALREKAKRKHLKTLAIRQRKYIEIL